MMFRDEKSMAARRQPGGKIRGTPNQWEHLHVLSKSCKAIPYKISRQFPTQSNRGQLLGPIKVDNWMQDFKLLVSEKKKCMVIIAMLTANLLGIGCVGWSAPARR